jgi:hypothetical protein
MRRPNWQHRFWHETVPDDWPDEEWLPYEQWIINFLEPEVRNS